MTSCPLSKAQLSLSAHANRCSLIACTCHVHIASQDWDMLLRIADPENTCSLVMWDIYRTLQCPGSIATLAATSIDVLL